MPCRSGVEDLAPVLEIDLATVLGAGTGAGRDVYGRSIAVNESGDVIAVGTSRNDIVLFDRRSGSLETRVIVRGASDPIG